MHPGSAPSKFWQQLSADHRDRLSSHGLGEVKRQQALRYFTWQWRWSRIRQSEQMRFLLKHTSHLSQVHAALEPQPLGRALWRGLPWAPADRWLYSFATRLLWDYASAKGCRDVLALGEPALGNPPPVLHRGQLISQDLANSSLEAEAILRGLGASRPSSILEIGAGYGRTAYSLLGLFPEARYVVVDIEPALSISRWYLSSLFPDRDVRFIPSEEATPGRLGRIDLALSISSLQEMTADQVASYIRLFDEVVRGHVFLKQWRRWANPEDGMVLQFDRYPIPDSWRTILREAAPVQTKFDQTMWSTVL